LNTPFFLIEFVGLPGSGKTTLAKALGDDLARAHISRADALADDLSLTRRHLRRALYVLPCLITHPRLIWGVLRRVRASRQGSPQALLKTCWNFWTVIGLTLSARSQGKPLVSDQGVVQAIWSVALSARQDVGDWWEFLVRYEVLPGILVVVHCPVEITSKRLGARPVGTSRLTGVTADDAAWDHASRILARLVSEARAYCAVVEVHNDGSRTIDALADEISRAIPADEADRPSRDRQSGTP
jgi:dephospho-CoA kinase